MNDSRITGYVVAAPRLWLRLEGGVVLVVSTYLYAQSAWSWWLFAVLFFSPDLSFVGYLAGPRVGALAYNIVHTYVAPAILSGGLLAAGMSFSPALIWTAHIGFDRLLGYGLKYSTAFQDTHLGPLGQSNRPTRTDA